jgi:hypothetical protein
MCPSHSFISYFVFPKFVSIFLHHHRVVGSSFRCMGCDSLIMQSGFCSVCVFVCVRACAPDSHGMGTFNHFKIGSRTASVSLARHLTCNSGTSLVKPSAECTATTTSVVILRIKIRSWHRVARGRPYQIPDIRKCEVFKSRRLRWAGHVARMGERNGAYRTLVGKPEGRRPSWKTQA